MQLDLTVSSKHYQCEFKKRVLICQFFPQDSIYVNIAAIIFLYHLEQLLHVDL